MALQGRCYKGVGGAHARRGARAVARAGPGERLQGARAVGVERFSNLPGTYHGPAPGPGAEEVTLLVPGGKPPVRALAGENLLRALEAAGHMHTTDFCFEGTCRLCECAVKGGASEAPVRGDCLEHADVVRACFAAVPSGRPQVEVSALYFDEPFTDYDGEDDGIDFV